MAIFSGPKDYATTRLILEGLRKEYSGKIYVISPDGNFGGEGIINISDEEILTQRALSLPNWYKQQLLKLLFLSHSKERKVFLIDGDTSLTKGVPLLEGKPVKLVSWESLVPYRSFLNLFDANASAYSTITHMAYYDLATELRIKANLPIGINSVEELLFYCFENNIRFSEYLLIGMFSEGQEMYFYNKDVFNLEEFKRLKRSDSLSISLQQWKRNSTGLRKLYHKIISI